MRVKQLWNHLPLPTGLILLWNRITFSRLTMAYFIFSILHFIFQLSFQIKAFTINANAASFLRSIVEQGHATNNSLPFLRGSSLYMCNWAPSNLNLEVAHCPMVWNGTKGTNVIGNQPGSAKDTITGSSMGSNILVPSPSSIPATLSTSSAPSISTFSSSAVVVPTSTSSRILQTITVFISPEPTGVSGDLGQKHSHEEDDDDDDFFVKRAGPQIMAFQEAGQTKVNISGMGFDNTPATLDMSCLWALNWPVSKLGNTKREDIVFVAFQFWVLGMSIVALLNESIPHILASLVTHMMATSWAGFQITHTANFRADFNRVITNGACDGISLLPTYWHDRGAAEIPGLALNVFALIISSFLTWRLIKLFGWQTFKRVGASLTINRVYKIVLILSITIQLCLFFIVVTVSLWLDQLINSPIGDLVDFRTLYKVASIITLILSVPWLMTGWFAVRRELRAPMFTFLVLSLLYLGGWSVMFFSTTFRWTFITWRFFSLMASASVLLTVISFVLGIVCRFNFGKGLLQYLSAEQPLLGEGFVYYGGSDMEKVDFPSNEKPIPTYSATFGSAQQIPPPRYMFKAQGPRFFNRSAQPFETVDVAMPPTAVTLNRKVSDGSPQNGHIARSDTRASDKSFGSLDSYYSYGHSRSESQQKRWSIE